MTWTLPQLEERYPDVPWRKPLRVTSGRDKGWACRVCIANHGLRGWAIPALPQTPQEVLNHIGKEHR